jgi:hypothetical protein
MNPLRNPTSPRPQPQNAIRTAVPVRATAFVGVERAQFRGKYVKVGYVSIAAQIA